MLYRKMQKMKGKKNQNYFQDDFFKCSMWIQSMIYIYHMIVFQQFCLSVLYQAGHINALLMVQNCSIFNIKKCFFFFSQWHFSQVSGKLVSSKNCIDNGYKVGFWVQIYCLDLKFHYQYWLKTVAYTISDPFCLQALGV